MHKTAFNTTDGPVAIDVLGHRIGGGEWGPVNTTDEVAEARIAAGSIVIVERPDGDIDPRAAAAFDATDRLNELAKQPAAEVKEQALEEGVVEDDDVTKAEAVEKLGRSGKGSR